MKRAAAFLLALLIAFSLAACGKGGEQTATETTFSGYCIKVTVPAGYTLYSVEESRALAGKAVLAKSEGGDVLLKMYCTQNGVAATVLAGAETEAQAISAIRKTLEATVNPSVTYNNLKNGTFTEADLIAKGDTLPEYPDALPGEQATSIDELKRVSAANDGSLAAAKDPETGLWGYIDKTGAYAIKPQFTSALDFSENLAAVSTGSAGTEMWGFIKRDGTYPAGLEPQFAKASSFSCGYALVSGGENGIHYINTNGSIAVTPFSLDLGIALDFFADGFTAASDFKNNYAVVGVKDATGNSVSFLIDTNGSVYCNIGSNLDKIVYDSSFSLSSAGYVIYRSETGKFGGIDTTGSIIVQFIYDSMTPAGDGLIGVSLKGKYGYVNFGSGSAVPLRYDGCTAFSGTTAMVRSNDMWGIIDKYGSYISAPRFSDARAFKNGLAAVQDGGYWGAVKSDGTVAVPALFTEIGDFSSGAAACLADGKYGFVDGEGRIIIEPTFAAAGSFN